MEDLTFRIEKKKPGMRYLRFLPKSLRPIGLFAIILSILSVLISVAFYPGMQKEIPIFYSMTSDQQLAAKEFIFIIPLISIFINVLHFLIAKIEKEIDFNILKMFLQITLVLQLLVFAILLRIIIIIN